MEDESYPECRAQELFDEFVSASTCRAALRSFSQLCEHLQLDPSAAERPLYQTIKRRLSYWRANGLWAKLDRRAAQGEYQRARVGRDMTVSDRILFSSNALVHIHSAAYLPLDAF